jgi:hypothetical protein
MFVAVTLNLNNLLAEVEEIEGLFSLGLTIYYIEEESVRIIDYVFSFLTIRFSHKILHTCVKLSLILLSFPKCSFLF